MTPNATKVTRIEPGSAEAADPAGQPEWGLDLVVGPFVKITIAVLVFAAVAIGVLHFLPPTSAISPFDRTISEYGLTDSAWLFNLGVTALAVGTAVLFAGLVRSGRIRPFSWSTAFAALWTAGLLTLVYFPKSQYTAASGDGGDVHRLASFIAFVSLPIAIALVARGLRSHRLAFWLGIGSLAWFVPMVAAAIIQAFTGGADWWTVIPLGLLERGMALTEIAAILALALLSSRRRGLELT